MTENSTQQILETGVAPLELKYFKAKNASRREFVGYYTELYINNPKLGTLVPGVYSSVTNRTVQSVRLATWALRRVIADSEKLFSSEPGPDFVAVYVPVRMIMKDYLDKLLNTASEKGYAYCSKLMLYVPSELLLEDSDEVRTRLNALKEKYRVRFALSEFGSRFCPTMRIEGLPLDAVLLDEDICNTESLASSSVRCALRMTGELKILAMLNKCRDDVLISNAFSAGCTVYIQDGSRTIKELYPDE